jgi:hypothetical protein
VNEVKENGREKMEDLDEGKRENVSLVPHIYPMYRYEKD